MMMPGRKFDAGSVYRYGFNGKENDNEVKGEGNQQDYGMRIYDPRLVRFLSEDPITKKYPELTPYQFASNSPISGIDLDGLEYYYAADGNLIAQSNANNTQVRIIKAEHLAAVKSLLTANKIGTPTLNRLSTDVGMNNAELNTRAFLSTIRQTENGGNAPLPYNSANGFTKGKVNTFTSKQYSEAPADYADHPGFLNNSNSSAAGAYQILQSSFSAYKKQNKDITDFSPASQDKIAMLMIKYRKATNDVANGDLEAASAKLVIQKGGEQFASLPGGSQSAMTFPTLKELYKLNVSNELNGKSIIATPKGELTQPKK